MLSTCVSAGVTVFSGGSYPPAAIRLLSGKEIRIHKQSQVYDFPETANIIHLQIKYFPSYFIPNWDYLLDHKVSNKTLLTQMKRPDGSFYAVYPATVKVKGLLNPTSLCSGTLQLGLLDPLTSKEYLGEVSYETWHHLHWEVTWWNS